MDDPEILKQLQEMEAEGLQVDTELQEDDDINNPELLAQLDELEQSSDIIQLQIEELTESIEDERKRANQLKAQGKQKEAQTIMTKLAELHAQREELQAKLQRHQSEVSPEDQHPTLEHEEEQPVHQEPQQEIQQGPQEEPQEEPPQEEDVQEVKQEVLEEPHVQQEEQQNRVDQVMFFLT